MNQYLEEIKKLKVLVIGDIMLDNYYYTDVSRISPESPVPVAHFKEEKLVLGGAANVALSVRNLGVKTYLLGEIGTDTNGVKLRGLLKNNDINFTPLISHKKTITKTRIVSKNNHLLRVDFEDKEKVSEHNSKEAKKFIKKIAKEIDVIIVSDYQKGLITDDLISFLRKIKKYIAIDTKPGSFTHFKGFSFIKPNFIEAVGLARNLGNKNSYKNNNSDVEKLGSFLRKKLKCDILLTRSEEGASFISKKVNHNKLEINRVSDVTGAGDTSIAIFSLLNYLKVPVQESLFLMNSAAKIAVSNVGTYAPKTEEIKKEIMKEETINVLSQDEIEELVPKLKKEKKKIVFTNGCFDLIHKGHVSILNRIKKLGDILIVGINSDSSVKQLKGPTRPLIDENSRAFVLSNIKAVDYVVIFDEQDPRNIIKKIKPNIHAKGGDYKKENMIETKVVEKLGGKVVILNLEEGYSTTNIVKKMNKKK